MKNQSTAGKAACSRAGGVSMLSLFLLSTTGAQAGHSQQLGCTVEAHCFMSTHTRQAVPYC